MKNQATGTEVIHKEVVVIGNGPSGISASVMLSGLVPYLVSRDHPDEMLAARLHGVDEQQEEDPDVEQQQEQQQQQQQQDEIDARNLSLVQQQAMLGQLANGLEGRTTNPVSLLLDALEHPCADLGFEIPALVQWRRDCDKQIDHVVLGKGPPGGSWHTMDPNVLTLSLGSWMALPGLPYTQTESTDSQRRASAGSVAKYYEHYVNEMNLQQYFETGVQVISIEPLHQHSSTTTITASSASDKKQCNKDCDIEATSRKKCSFANALNFIRTRTKCHKKTTKKDDANRNCKRPRDSKHDLSPNRKVRELIDRSYFSINLKLTDDEDGLLPRNLFSTNRNKTINRCLSYPMENDCDKMDNQANFNNRLCQCFQDKYVPNDDSQEMEVLTNYPAEARWLVHTYNTSKDKYVSYTCCNLILANGASDLPNRLGLAAETYDLPWILHDLKTLEDKLDNFTKTMTDGSPDPVLIVGAGLSAADAVIATRFRSIPVLHVFRNRSVSLDKQLPENMYPEYHKVHQMMLDGGSAYPLYTALPEHRVADISTTDKTVTIVSKSGVPTHHKVSFVVILIGSRPNLNFLPPECSTIGVNKSTPIDSKSNTIDIDKLTHSVNGYDGLYAIGPLAGDNFVRFIPGGALAVLSDLYAKRNW